MVVVPQGVTLRLMGEKLVIARIMHGGLIHRQGLLKVGDVVKEVNGEVVSSMQPVELQAMLVRKRDINLSHCGGSALVS